MGEPSGAAAPKGWMEGSSTSLRARCLVWSSSVRAIPTIWRTGLLSVWVDRGLWTRKTSTGCLGTWRERGCRSCGPSNELVADCRSWSTTRPMRQRLRSQSGWRHFCRRSRCEPVSEPRSPWLARRMRLRIFALMDVVYGSRLTAFAAIPRTSPSLI